MVALFNARGLDVVEKVNIVMAYIVTVRRAPFVVVASCVTQLGWRARSFPCLCSCSISLRKGTWTGQNLQHPSQTT